MATPLILDEVKEPEFVVVSKGVEHKYDPWALAKQLESLQGVDAKQLSASTDAVKAAFGLPDITVTQCLALLAGLFEFVREIPEIKKLQGLTQS